MDKKDVLIFDLLTKICDIRRVCVHLRHSLVLKASSSCQEVMDLEWAITAIDECIIKGEMNNFYLHAAI